MGEPEPPRLPRIALGVEYDGGCFDGWQTQPHGRTVQDTLEAALRSFAAAPVATICAGRTDAGVHARGQVVSFPAPCERELPSWVRGTNRYLPPGAAVRWARVVPDSFDARRAARSRWYDYWILEDRVRSPLLAGRATWCWRPLAAERMHEAAQLLVGEHDFSAFRASECQALSPVRQLHQLDVARFGRLVRLRLRANAFLHHMVRNIAGALLEVGQGRKDPAWMGELLQSRDRRRGPATASAEGLYLMGVEYEASLGLPSVPDSLELPPWIEPA